MKTCCAILDLALSRARTDNQGLYVGQLMNFRTGDLSDRLAIGFRRARRKEQGTYGADSRFANSTFAMVVFCPFCGSKNPLQTKKTKRKKA